MVKAATDTLAPEDQALQESFWGRGAERQRSRSDHPTARIGAPTPTPRRRAASSPRRRSGKGRVFLTWLLVTVVLAGVVAGGWWWRNRDGAPRTAARTTEGVTATPVPVATVSSPVTVLSHRAADGRLDLAMAVGTNQAGTKSSVLLLPVGTQLEVPANGIQQLAELHRLGGDPLVDLGVENALGVAVGQSVILDDAALKAMFDATGQLLVTLPRAVAIAEPALNLPAGSQTLTPEQAVTLLTRTPTGVSELDRLDTVRAVLNAWLDALQSGDRAASVAQAAATAAPLTTAARTGATVDVLPVDSIGLGADERYVIAASDAQRAVSNAFPRRGVHDLGPTPDRGSWVGRPGNPGRQQLHRARRRQYSPYRSVRSGRQYECGVLP